MTKQIIFAGGIHGVGKSTLCRDISSKLSLCYLSASEVIKWRDLNTDSINKKVLNIPDTQNRLICGLDSILKIGETYLLDGHYCLLNKDGQVTEVPMETFLKINPMALVLVTGSISAVKSAIEKRDRRIYEAELLTLMQEKEISYAHNVASYLNIPLFVFDTETSDVDDLIYRIHESLT